MQYQPPQGTQYPPQPQWQQPPVMPTPKPRRSRRRLWLILAGIVALIVIVVAVANSNHGSPSAAPTVQATTQSSPSSSHPTSTAHSAGQAVTVGDWQVTVNSAKTSTGTEFSAPKAGMTYLVVDVTVKNTASSNQNISSLISFKLQDSTGQEYTEQITTIGKPPDGVVTPGSLLRGQLVYEVPTSEHAFTFQFQGSLTSSDVATWNISVK